MRYALVVLFAVPILIGAQPGVPENNLIYEIFVRSFADSDGDGVGDLNGITARLDSYLNDGRPETDHDLEVGVLWLMPVFPSTSYHGYDVTDFRGITAAYGSMTDFRTLLAEAHRRGVRVILDLPLNHTSNKHPWFTAALNDPASPQRGYYEIAADNGPLPDRWHRARTASGAAVRYFGLFSSTMPDLVFEHAAVRVEAKSVAKFWLDLGVDGFRLDAAKHVYGDHFGEALAEDEIARNNAWWQEFSRFVYGVRPDAILVGEVLGSREMMRRHAWGLDGLLDEPFMNELRAQLAAPGPGMITAWQQFEHAARALNHAAHNPALPFADRAFHMFPFVGSHDRNPRLASELEDLQWRGRGPGVDPACRLAVYLLLGLASHPVLYTGDEIMQRGWKWRGNPPDHPTEPGDGSRIYDETLREPFPGSAAAPARVRRAGSRHALIGRTTAFRAKSRSSPAACCTCSAESRTCARATRISRTATSAPSSPTPPTGWGLSGFGAPAAICSSSTGQRPETTTDSTKDGIRNIAVHNSSSGATARVGHGRM